MLYIYIIFILFSEYIMDGGGISSGIGSGIVKHIFKFDDATKNEILNILQYSGIALFPAIGFAKIMQKYVPETDELKSSWIIAGEVILQVFVIFLGIFFIHRLVTCIPPYSGVAYPEFMMINVILITLIIFICLQTRLGEKISILVDRISNFINGSSGKKNANSNQQKLQPLSGGIIGDGPNAGLTPLSSVASSGNNGPVQPPFAGMYAGGTQPLPGAATPGGMVEPFDPVPATDVGSIFGGWP